MTVYTRIRNGMEPDVSGNGGATEGDLRGDFSDIIDVIGVADLSGGQLLVHEAGTPAMTVVVDAGVGYIPNTPFDYTDSDSVRFWEAVVTGTTGSRTLVIGANSSGQTRVDKICLKIDSGTSPDQYASNVSSLIVVAGTPGAGAPATPDYHLALAQVTVLNGATEILNAKISDSRVQSKISTKFLPDTIVYTESTIVRTDSTQNITGEKTFSSAKLKATRPKITTSIDDSAGVEVFKVPAGEQVEVAKGSFQALQSYSPAGGATATLDLALGNDHAIQMPAGNITIALSNAKVGQKFIVSITQDGTGSRTVTWFTTIRWFPNGVTPILTTTGSKRDVFVFRCTGSNTYDGFIAGQGG